MSQSDPIKILKALPYGVGALTLLGAAFALGAGGSLETCEAWLVAMSWLLTASVGMRLVLDGRAWGAALWASPVATALFLSLAWLGCSPLWGYNPAHSWGYVLSILSFGSAAFSLSAWFSAEARARDFVMACVLGLSGVEAFVALAQQLCWPLDGALRVVSAPAFLQAGGGFALWLRDYVDLIHGAAVNGVPWGTLGNPNYLAEFLVLVIPGVIAYSSQVPRKGLRFSLYGVSALFFWVLLATGCRTAVGAIFLMPVLAALIVWGPRELSRSLGQVWAKKWARWGAGGALVGMLALLVCRPHLHLLWKIGRASQAGDLGLQSRFQAWESAWSLVVQHPWLGQGIGSFKLRLEDIQAAAHVRQVVPSERFIHLHNEPLQAWVEAGVIGVLLGLFTLAAWSWGVRNHSVLPLRMRWALLSSVWGCLFTGVLGFPLHIPLTAFVLMVVISLGLPPVQWPVRMQGRVGFAYASAFLVFCVLFAWQLSEKSVWGRRDAALHQALAKQALLWQDTEAAAVLADWAVGDARFKAKPRSLQLGILTLAGRHKEVVAIFEASEKDGLGPDSRLAYAQSLTALGRKPEAMQQLERIQEIYGDTQSVGLDAKEFALKHRLQPH